MNGLVIGTLLATLLVAFLPANASAAHATALAKVAARLGYVYSYLGPEDAVSMTRRGVTVVIRPGERLFDVNDRTEAMDGEAPRFSHSDIYVSDGLVARLRQLARAYPSGMSVDFAPAAPPEMRTGVTVLPGAIAGLRVFPVAGQQQVGVEGKAPPNLPITLTLVATFSTELPDVVLSRHEVATDAEGTFKTNLSIASGYFRGSILTLVATSLPGISSAKTQIVMKAPNGNVSIPADQVPSSIR